MKIEELKVGDKFKSEANLLQELNLYSTKKAIRDKNKEYVRTYITYETTGVKVGRCEEIVITATNNKEVKPKEDKRKQGNNTGHYKYHEEFRETMLWLMRDWEIGTINHDYMKNIMVKTGLVSDKFFKLKFTEESDIEEYQTRNSRIKYGIVEKSLERMEEEGLIDYRKCLRIIDYEDEERDTFKDEYEKYKVVEKEVIKDMGYNGFFDLDLHNRLNPDKKIMDEFNELVLERMKKLFGWKKIICSHIRLVKNIDVKGSDMRKQLNDKVCAAYKEHVEKKNKDFLNELYESICASPLNLGREDKLMERYEAPHKDILSDAMEDDRLEELQEIARKEEKMKAYESFKQEDVKPMENSYYEFDPELYAEAKRTEQKKEQRMTVFGEMMSANRNDSNDNEDDDVVFEFE